MVQSRSTPLCWGTAQHPHHLFPWRVKNLGPPEATSPGSGPSSSTWNILVCLAISWEKRLQNVTNYFLMSLAMTDLMVAILVMPLGILTLVRERKEILEEERRRLLKPPRDVNVEEKDKYEMD
ncbi:hypothetical protein WDU94_002420 [Cyamophila willieti]